MDVTRHRAALLGGLTLGYVVAQLTASEELQEETGCDEDEGRRREPMHIGPTYRL
jgi:hypothetical protein